MDDTMKQTPDQTVLALAILEALTDLFGGIVTGRKALSITVTTNTERLSVITKTTVIRLADIAPTPPDGSPPSSDTRLILAGIKGLSNMQSATQAAIAVLNGDQAILLGDLEQLLAQGATATQTAVAAALAAAGLSDADNAAAIQALDASQKAETAKIVAALTPTPPTAIVISPTSITGVPGQALTGAFAASGGAGGPYTFATSGLPSDISVDASGNYSGTPADAEDGTFQVTATDIAGTASDPVDVSFAITAASGQ